jgi:hypothetical protein
MWSCYDGHFDLAERDEDDPCRKLQREHRQIDYMGRWNNKFTDIEARSSGVDHNRFDGNPFT